MAPKRQQPENRFKIRWLIIMPLLAILILTIALMVKEYKDQKVRESSPVTYNVPIEYVI